MTERSSGPEQEGRLTRRNVLIESALGAAAPPIVSATGADADVPRAAPAVGNNGDVDLPVNVSIRRLSLDPRTTSLETMREHLGLTGAKKGCEHGQCGIGTMLAGGRRVLSCPTLAVRGARACHDDRGLAAADGTLHPMQQAFIDQDAFLCGIARSPDPERSCLHHRRACPFGREQPQMCGDLCQCAPGNAGINAAVANAAFDATGVRVRELPIQLEKLLGSPERVGVISSKGMT